MRSDGVRAAIRHVLDSVTVSDGQRITSEEKLSKVVRRAWQRLTMRIHPDKLGREQTAEEFEQFEALGTFTLLVG